MDLLLLLSILSQTLASELEPVAPAALSLPEARRSPVALRVRSEPNTDSDIVGMIAPNAAFWVIGRVAGIPCGASAPGDAAGSAIEAGSWGLLPGGFACLTGTTADPGPPAALPKLIAFDAPRPEEYHEYVATGSWPRDRVTTEGSTPFIYGKAWRSWRGTTYANLQAWEHGDAPLAQLSEGRKYHFVGVVEAVRGPVLELADGKVVPLDDVYIYPVSRFHGVELTGATALRVGEVQGWVRAYGGANLREAATSSSARIALIPNQTAVRVRSTSDPRWLEVADALGTGRVGYLARTVVSRALPGPVPEGVAAGALWVDVDVDEQVLMLMQGDAPVFATLVSTGVDERDTPPGVYTLLDKTIYGDMESRLGAPEAEAYHVESVPWIVHFRPRYAFHATFWHWGFGHRASHGCVNLSPSDARRVFDAVSPRLPEGWSTVQATPGQPGTTVRIRESP